MKAIHSNNAGTASGQKYRTGYKEGKFSLSTIKEDVDRGFRYFLKHHHAPKPPQKGYSPKPPETP